MSKISIRFYKDHKVRAVWDEANNQWWFSVLDIVGAINQQDDHEKNRNYWKYLKAKLRKEENELVSATTQLKLTERRGNCQGSATDSCFKNNKTTGQVQDKFGTSLGN